MFVSWFSEPEVGVPSISDLLCWYGRGQHDESSSLHSLVLVRKNTMISLYLEIWHEDFIWWSEFISEVDEIFVRHIVGDSLFWTWTYQGVDVVYWEMYFVGQFGCNFTLIGASGVRMEGSAVQNWDLEVVEVIGGPLALHEKLGVGVRAVPVGGVHAVEVSKNVGRLVPIRAVAHCEGNFIIWDEGFIFEYCLGHHHIEIFDSWAEIQAGQFNTDVEDVEGQIEAWGYWVDGDLVGPFDLFPPDCAEGHASEDDGKEDDDGER